MATKAPPKSTASKRQQWLSAVKKSASDWKQARTVEPGQQGDRPIPDIENGTYFFKLSSIALEMSKGSKKAPPSPFVVTKLICVEGEYKGVTVERLDYLGGKTADQRLRNFQNFAKHLMGFGLQVKKMELNEALVAKIEELAKEKPVVQVGIKRWGNAVEGDEALDKGGLNVYVNHLATDEEMEDAELFDEDLDDEEEEEEEEETEEDEYEEDSDDSDSDEEDEEEDEDEEEEDEDEVEEEEDVVPVRKKPVKKPARATARAAGKKKQATRRR